MTSPSIVRNQQQTFGRLWQSVHPYVRADRDLPARLQAVLRRREFGARDRRLYRELLYTAVRHLPWTEQLAARAETEMIRAVAWLAADTPATHEFRAALAGDWPDCPAAVAGRAQFLGVDGGLLPEWFRRHCPEAFVPPNLEVLATRPPLWIRLQTADAGTIHREFAQRGWPVRPAAVLPTAAEIPAEADVTSTRTYQEGRFEVQDLGSQMILASAPIEPDGCWLDACAGAGGKTLQLATLAGPAGRVDAYDVRPDALTELRERARRGGFDNIRVLERIPAPANYDGVLVDAPCSGSGTWRRAPHLKWCTTPADIAAHAGQQRQLLAQLCAQVRPGGLLVYATCSLSRVENQEVVEAFLAGHPEFTAVPPARSFGCRPDGAGLTIFPAVHNTDGYFVSQLARRR
ncbi:MAG TPA: RsmB/NOP family class I SAM-dependent RNA methyltransferase [Opitutaceae bacterium]|nr:RsmB/NOP family class I SAM-dependent RNA methyltransferase [Opitutaceae bacterium]